MITHGIDEFMDDLRRTWCGINFEPMDPRPADDAVVDCMSCLVQRARSITITLHSDGSVTVEPLVGRES